jgi:glyoxylase-like metal-dependent hydrolase (beta-lactamase superfamily II)
MCPFGGRLVSGRGGIFERAELVCHCLLVESNDGLILVDAGLAHADLANPIERLGRPFVLVANPRIDPDDTALSHVLRLGFQHEDVRHIVLTHGDLDHAGGLSDFPNAQVHVFEKEHAAIMSPTAREKHRYRRAHFAHDPKFVVHPVDGETWRGFSALRVIDAVKDDLMMIPLVGHTRGHVGVAVRGGDRWWLHAGDAYFHRQQMDPERPSIPGGLGGFQRFADVDTRARVENQERLRKLSNEGGADLTVFCAHDPVEFENCGPS